MCSKCVEMTSEPGWLARIVALERQLAAIRATDEDRRTVRDQEVQS
jgi:hypothetical protein